MNLASRWFEDNDNKEVIVRCVTYLLENELLSGKPAVGCAKFVVLEGLDALNGKQVLTFNRYVMPLIPTDCPQCRKTLQGEDIMIVLKRMGNCSNCQVSPNK